MISFIGKTQVRGGKPQQFRRQSAGVVDIPVHNSMTTSEIRSFAFTPLLLARMSHKLWDECFPRRGRGRRKQSTPDLEDIEESGPLGQVFENIFGQAAVGEEGSPGFRASVIVQRGLRKIFCGGSRRRSAAQRQSLKIADDAAKVSA